MQDYPQEAKLHARKLHYVLTHFYMDWATSYQGTRFVTRHSLRENLSLSDEHLNEAIEILKDYYASTDQPSLTAVIEKDVEGLSVHDVLYSLNRLLSIKTLPSQVMDSPVQVLSDEPATWLFTLTPAAGGDFDGDQMMALKDEYRLTDLDWLPEYHKRLF